MESYRTKNSNTEVIKEEKIARGQKGATEKE